MRNCSDHFSNLYGNVPKVDGMFGVTAEIMHKSFEKFDNPLY